MSGKSRGKFTVWDSLRYDEMEGRAVQADLHEAKERLSEVTTTAEQGKPSPLEEFVDRCLRAARDELRRRDPSFAGKAEAQSRLESIGLQSHENVLDTAPRARLHKHWHVLLESCYDLPGHFSNARIAASGLGKESFTGLSPGDAYKRGNFYRSSLSAFLQALLEHVKYMIECVTKAYLPALSDKQRKRIHHPYKEQLSTAFRNITEGRNKHLHPGRKNAFADAITERGYWEYMLFAGDVNPFRAPGLSSKEMEAHAGNFHLGEWAYLEKVTDYFCDILGRVLLDLEDDLTQRVAKRSTANASDGTMFAVPADAKPITNEDVARALDD